MLSLNDFLYSVGENSYMFVVLSAGINTLDEAFTFALSTFIKFRYSLKLHFSWVLYRVE